MVLESSSQALIPAPPETEVYSLDDPWILGVDFGSTAIRVSLLNANTGKVYPLYLDDADELPCKLVWHSDHSLDDPMDKEAYINIKNRSKCNLIVKINGKKYYNLDVPANGQNFLLVEKGEYILTTMVCDAKYSSLKKINKDIEIELNLSE